MEFEINLLPHKPYNLWLEKAKRNRAAIVLSILGLSLILLVGIYARVITKKTTQVVASGQEFVKVTLEREKVSGLVKKLYEVQDAKTVWSEKLMSLSDATPDQVFLTAMKFEEEKSRTRRSSSEGKTGKLVLQGVVVTAPGEDPSFFIQKFMQELKTNPSFMAGFRDPVLISVSNPREEHQRITLDFEFHLLQR